MVISRDCGGGFTAEYNDRYDEVSLLKVFPDDPETGAPRSVFMCRYADIIIEEDPDIAIETAMATIRNAYDKIDLSELSARITKKQNGISLSLSLILTESFLWIIWF